MKLNDIKHNHSLTDLLKILIFSILMMIPFIDVGIRCAYVVCNKNAYQSYYGETINEKQETLITNDLKLNDNYHFYNDVNMTPQTTTGRCYMNVSNITYNNTSYDDADNLVWFCYPENNPTACNIYIRSGNTVLIEVKPSNYVVNLYFTFEGFTNYNAIFDIYKPYIYKITYNDYSYLDNVFNYSVNKLTTSELYTWTQQTAIYTGVQTMCAQLGINNTVIPLLLVYWFILTVIYIIIDIVLKLFTMLTHAIGSKTA